MSVQRFFVVQTRPISPDGRYRFEDHLTVLPFPRLEQARARRDELQSQRFWDGFEFRIIEREQTVVDTVVE